MVRDTHGGVAIEEEAETGTVISGRLLEMANQIQEGDMSEQAAIAEARRLIAQNTQAP